MNKGINIYLADISKHAGQTVVIKGWVYNLRSSGKILFLQIRDGTGTIQGVMIKTPDNQKYFNQVKELTLESAVAVTGKIRQDQRAPTGYEIDITDITVISLAEVDYPIGKKEHGPDFLLDHRHLWLRTARQRAIQKIRDEIIYVIITFFRKHRFTRLDTPIITPNACEGTTSLFAIDFFGRKAFLSQSGQLYLEAGIASLGRVYDFAPVFRAEKSKTRRHLIEFWMMDAEAAFMEHEENMNIQEGLIQYVVQNILDLCTQELSVLNRDLSILKQISRPFLRITYDEALQQLHALGSDIKYGEDLGNDDETRLTSTAESPIFVQYYPAKVKAFYMKRHSQSTHLVLNDDLLAPEGYGEIIGGSERENSYQVLLQSIRNHRLSEKDFGWYLDLRKYGSVPHAGFGLGLERLVAWICGLKHVRETIPFPRLLNRNYP